MADRAQINRPVTVFREVSEEQFAPIGRPADEPIRGVSGEVRERHPKPCNRVTGSNRLAVEIEPVRCHGTELREQRLEVDRVVLDTERVRKCFRVPRVRRTRPCYREGSGRIRCRHRALRPPARPSPSNRARRSDSRLRRRRWRVPLASGGTNRSVLARPRGRSRRRRGRGRQSSTTRSVRYEPPNRSRCHLQSPDCPRSISSETRLVPAYPSSLTATIVVSVCRDHDWPLSRPFIFGRLFRMKE